MKLLVVVALVFATFSLPSAEAAVVYLRFEGSIDNDYDESHRSYNADYGLVAGQSVVMVFRVDTESDPPGQSDTQNIDRFVVENLGGTFAESNTYGATETVVEGSTSVILGIYDIYFGTFYPYPPDGDRSIDTWEVGHGFDLNGSCEDEYCDFGGVSLTYRGTTLPTPIPGAAWLFLSGMALIGLVKR